MTNNIKEESYIENEIINKIKNIERRSKKYPPTRSIILELITLKESQQLAEKIKPYTREEYLEITKRQKPVDGYVPYAEARGSHWIESSCCFLRRIFGLKDDR
jgi:hypothetical protein